MVRKAVVRHLLDEIAAAEAEMEKGNFHQAASRVKAAVNKAVGLLEAEQITSADMNAVNRSALNATRRLRRLVVGKRI